MRPALLPSGVRDVRPLVQPGTADTVLIFDDATGAVVDVDFRGTVAEIRARLTRAAAVDSEVPVVAQGPGRPKAPASSRAKK